MGELRRLRPRRRVSRASSGTRRPRGFDVSGAGRRRQAARLSEHQLLADGEHAEAAPRGERVHGGAPRARAAGGHPRMSLDSPNVEGLDAWAFEPRRVEKPWGHELIWAQ